VHHDQLHSSDPFLSGGTHQSQLTALIKTRLRRMQYRPGLLGGFLASTGLDLTPFCEPRN
jgi:hypothetical protein